MTTKNYNYHSLRYLFVTSLVLGLYLFEVSGAQGQAKPVPVGKPAASEPRPAVQPEKKPKPVVIAILDSGMDLKTKEFKPYQIYSYDFTGEGVSDLNGHGTHVTGIILSQIKSEAPDKFQLLNIKILDKYLKTDEVRLLKGLQTAVDHNAKIVNLSAGGIRKAPTESVATCRKILSILRRNPDTLFILSAGNDGLDLDKLTDVMIPVTCERAPISPDLLQVDFLQDATFLIEQAKLEQAEKWMMGVKELSKANNDKLPAKTAALESCLSTAKEYLLANDNTQRQFLEKKVQQGCNALIKPEVFFHNVQAMLESK